MHVWNSKNINESSNELDNIDLFSFFLFNILVMLLIFSNIKQMLNS